MVSGGTSFIAVMQSTELTHRYNPPDMSRLNWSWNRRVFLQRQVRSRSVVVIAIGSKDSPQRAFIEHDHMIETFPPDGADDPFHIGPLPR